MMKEFDFNDIGKREPYSVSDECLAAARQRAMRLWGEMVNCRCCAKARRGAGSGTDARRSISTGAVVRWAFAIGAVVVLAAVSLAGVYASKHKILMYRYEHVLAKASMVELEDAAGAYAEDFQEQVTDLAPEEVLQNTSVSL